MVGKEYTSEKQYYKDSKTGYEIIQLTKGPSNNRHIYFVDNSFTLGDKEIVFTSDRSSDRPFVYNYFKMDLTTGIMIQLTDEPNGISRGTKTPDSEFIVYVAGNKMKKLNTKTGQNEVIYEQSDPHFKMTIPFISPNKKYAGVILDEANSAIRGDNYSGFKEKLYTNKIGKIKLVYLDGSKAFDIYEDTHYLEHFQFAPDDSTIAMFCHEGPWNLVHQRIWILDLVSRSVIPCFRQGEDDCVGHEFWTRDGRIFFDNRRKGHDGTITSSRTQATIAPEVTDQVPYVGFANRNGELERKVDMPFYCNHYHANIDSTLLVGDEVDDLVLIDIKIEKANLKTLCTHNTSWCKGDTHPHPTFSWDNSKILFRSDRDHGNVQLYLVNLDQVFG